MDSKQFNEQVRDSIRRKRIESIRKRMWSYVFLPLEYGIVDMVIDSTGIRTVSINGIPSAAMVCSLNYADESQRTIDDILETV